MSKKIKNKGYGAISDVDPDDVVDVFEKLVKIIKDWRKK